MRFKPLLVFLLIVSMTINFSTATAIQGGESALGNQYVVPVYIEVTATTNISCSGSVISPRVVAPAGHCILDKSGLISKRILIGQPGSLNKPSPDWITVAKVLVDDTFKGNTSDGKLGNSDIAILVLEKPLKGASKVELASDAVFSQLKQSSSKLRIIGYGVISDSRITSDEPRFLDTTLTSNATSDPNTTLLSSSTGTGCVGDSGAPALSITPTKVTLVGIVIGGELSDGCGKKQPSGVYLSMITNLSRFSNLVADAISESSEIAQSENKSSVAIVEQERDELQRQLDSVSQELTDTREKLTKELNDLVLAIKQSGLKSIKCTKGATVKAVVSKSPVCPAGYKKK
jgi:secreted trypsin-like serine protease